MQSRLILRAFQLLIRIIEQPSGREDISIRHSPSVLSLSRPDHARTAVAPADASSLAVAVLANIVCANIDIGLKHCLALGYHRDPVLRVAFMQIISYALRHGARFGSSAAAANAKRQSAKHRPFLDLLVGGNMAIAVAIIDVCPSADVDDLAGVLFQAFEAKGTLISFLRILIEREVAQTSTSASFQLSTTRRSICCYR